jgi:hypothetical protein
MMDQFNDYVKLEAICTYLKSFGYKAMVHNNSMSVHVMDKEIILVFTTWEVAREFIRVQAQRGLIKV